MLKLPNTSVKQSTVANGRKLPRAIATSCPFCGKLVAFSFSGYHPGEKIYTATANCPACDQAPTFVFVDPPRKEHAASFPAEICMYPEPTAWHAVADISSEIPSWLNDAFTSAVESYNAGIYTATAVCARRTLEGLFKHAVSDDKKKLNLVGLIEEVSKSPDLAAPLNALAHALRAGGNLGAHFDAEKSPDANMARQMVELLEYLISYLHILPKKIGELEKSLSK